MAQLRELSPLASKFWDCHHFLLPKLVPGLGMKEG